MAEDRPTKTGDLRRVGRMGHRTSSEKSIPKPVSKDRESPPNSPKKSKSILGKRNDKNEEKDLRRTYTEKKLWRRKSSKTPKLLEETREKRASFDPRWIDPKNTSKESLPTRSETTVAEMDSITAIEIISHHDEKITISFLTSLKSYLDKPDFYDSFVKNGGFFKLFARLTEYRKDPKRSAHQTSILNAIQPQFQKYDFMMSHLVQNEELLNSVALATGSTGSIIKMRCYLLLASLPVVITSSGIEGFNAHKAVLKALDYYTYMNESYRFQHLVQTLQHEKTEEVKVAALALVNMIISTPNDLEERIGLRNQFLISGLNKILQEIVISNNNQGGKLRDQIMFFNHDKSNDEAEMQSNVEKLTNIAQVWGDSRTPVILCDRVVEKLTHHQHLLQNFLLMLVNMLKWETDDIWGTQKWRLTHDFISRITTFNIDESNKDGINMNNILKSIVFITNNSQHQVSEPKIKELDQNTTIDLMEYELEETKNILYKANCQIEELQKQLEYFEVFEEKLKQSELELLISQERLKDTEDKLMEHDPEYYQLLEEKLQKTVEMLNLSEQKLQNTQNELEQITRDNEILHKIQSEIKLEIPQPRQDLDNEEILENYNSLKNVNHILENENCFLKNRIDELEKKQVSISENSFLIEEKLAKIESLEAALYISDNSKIELESKLSKLMEEHEVVKDSWNNEILVKEDSLRQLKKTYNILLESSNINEANYQKIEKNFGVISDENNKLHSQLKEYEEKYKKIREKNKSLEKENTNLNQEIKNSKKKQSLLEEELKISKESLQSFKNQENDEERRNWETKLMQSEKSSTILQEKLSQMEEKFKESLILQDRAEKVKIEEVSQINEKLKHTKERLRKRDEEFILLRAEFEHLRIKERESTERLEKERAKELSILEKKIEKKNYKIKIKDSEIEKLKSELDKLRGEIRPPYILRNDHFYNSSYPLISEIDNVNSTPKVAKDESISKRKSSKKARLSKDHKRLSSPTILMDLNVAKKHKDHEKDKQSKDLEKKISTIELVKKRNKHQESDEDSQSLASPKKYFNNEKYDLKINKNLSRESSKRKDSSGSGPTTPKVQKRGTPSILVPQSNPSPKNLNKKTPSVVFSSNSQNRIKSESPYQVKSFTSYYDLCALKFTNDESIFGRL